MIFTYLLIYWSIYLMEFGQFQSIPVHTIFGCRRTVYVVQAGYTRLRLSIGHVILNEKSQSIFNLLQLCRSGVSILRMYSIKDDNNSTSVSHRICG